MAITFKNAPASFNPKPEIVKLQNMVRAVYKLPAGTDVRVGMSRTIIEDKTGVKVEMPFGIANLQNNQTDKMSIALGTLFGTFVNAFGEAGVEFSVDEDGATNPTPKSFDEMSDEEWIEATSNSLFPASIPLYQATEIHAPVHGTSGGSIYRACFLGPTLKGAARIKGTGVSFRFTTAENKCPSGDMKSILKRLGVTNEYGNRMTVHAPMPGVFNEHSAEYRALFGAYYAALKPYLNSPFPSIAKLAEGVA